MLVLPSKPESATPGAGSVSAPRGNPPDFPLSFQQPLSLSLSELAANFYFTHYSYGGPPLSSGFYSWVAGVYAEQNHPLSAIIEAIGMSAISNTRFAPDIAACARRNYGRVLAATTMAIASPVGAVADTTLMAVLLLGLYEVPTHNIFLSLPNHTLLSNSWQFVSFETWDGYTSWDAHIRGAAALFQLQEQHRSESPYTRYLFALLRSQCVRMKIEGKDLWRLHS